ncbi:MMPL family transporter [Timonella sp. A28]|uniref:MMPL family transporter n=1 Tax=Timonella sp. A28 TaxID=3442640 RepID=UPI003EC0DCC1
MSSKSSTSANTSTTRTPLRLLRTLIPALLILTWLAAAAIGGPLFGRVDEVSSNEATAYLPTNAQATQVQKQLPGFLGDSTIPAVIVLASEETLTEAEIGQAQAFAGQLADTTPGVLAASPAIPSEDGKALQIFAQLDAKSDIGIDVEALKTQLDETFPNNIDHYVTGPAGFTADLSEAFGGIDGLLLAVALTAVLIILLIVYRSPILPIAVLTTSMFALTAALATIWLLAKQGWILLNGQTQGILFILVIGAATDYGLLYVSRYKEELKRHHSTWAATQAALRGSFEPILASGGTVIAGLLCLMLSQLQSNRDLGPIAAIGILFAMLAAFTLLPAILFLFGRVAYWPRKPKVTNEDGTQSQLPTKGLWKALPNLVSKKPRTLWAGTTVLLLIASAGVLTLKADGVAQSELILGESNARDGQTVLAEHFPAGSGNPAFIIAAEQNLDTVSQTLLANDGVSSVAVTAKDSPAGSLQVTPQGIQNPTGVPAEPTVVDGNVLIQATLSDAFDSPEAENTVRELRETLGQDAIVGGATATALDTNEASIHDRNLIIPLVLLVIFIILSLLLRSLLAPLLLVATTVLSFAATLGIAALVFNHIAGFPGADPAVPLYSFVFLVALGIDYNIFLMTRVREETLTHGTHTGMSRGLAITGGVITSAGLVLAATFAALAVIPILFLAQIAFIVAFGVLMDTFLVRTVLVPALGYDIGRKIWWPSRLAHGKE